MPRARAVLARPEHPDSAAYLQHHPAHLLVGFGVESMTFRPNRSKAMKIRAVLAAVGILLASVSFGETVSVNTPGDGFLALRSEPSAKHGVRLSKIPHGALIDLSECTSSASNARWCRTAYQGKGGWVLEKYVTRLSSGLTTSPVVRQARRTSNVSENDAILRAVANQCTPDWCTPRIGTVLGEYATVGFGCKKQDCESAIAYLKKTGGNWIIVDQGTGITPDDLVEYGFPADVANELAY